MRSSPIFSRREKILLGILAFINFSHVVDFMMIMPLGPRFMRIFDITPHQFGLLVSTYTFSAGIMAVLTSFFVDRFDRKKNLLFFYTGFCISTIGCALSPTYHIFLIARIVAGAFGGVMSSMSLAIVGDVISVNHRGSAVGVLRLGVSAASVFGIPLSLFLANQFDWHAPFLLLGLLSFSLIFVIIFAIPPMKRHLEKPRTSTSFQDFWVVLKSSNQQLALLFMFCLCMGQFMMVPFISPTLVANAGVLETQLQYVYLVGGCFTFFSAPFFGRASDKFGSRKIFYICVIISMIPIYLITHLQVTPLYYLLPISTCFFIIMGGRMIPATALVLSTVKPEHRGTFMSLNNAVQQFGSSLAAYIAGLVLVKNATGNLEHYDLVGYICLVFSGLTILLIGKIKTVE